MDTIYGFPFTIDGMRALRNLLAVLTVLFVATQGFALADPRLLVEMSLYKKNITGARSRWELAIKDDGSVTVNSKAADPLSAEDLAKLNEAIAQTDFPTLMKTKSTQGLISSQGGIDQGYRLPRRGAVQSWVHNWDPKAPFFKLMDEISKRYKPSFDRQSGRGGRGG